MAAASGIYPPALTRVTLVGLGAIGREVLKALLDKQTVRVVAVVWVFVRWAGAGGRAGACAGSGCMGGDCAWVLIGAGVSVIGVWLGWRTWPRRTS